uniref:Uncharacterized protein n=1 Tax=Ditylenchus dipsaci TaxID=166011 RepID=A0A915DAW3_9BILA
MRLFRHGQIGCFQISTSFHLQFFQQDTINFEPKMLGILQRCGPFLKELGFGSRWLKISQPIIQHVARYCHQLTKLDLGCIILNADISPILKVVAHRLEYFSLEETSWTSEENAMKTPENILHSSRSNIKKSSQPISTEDEKPTKVEFAKIHVLSENIVAVSYKLEVVDLSGTKRLSVDVLAQFLTSHANLKEIMMCPFPYFHFQHSVFRPPKVMEWKARTPLDYRLL